MVTHPERARSALRTEPLEESEGASMREFMIEPIATISTPDTRLAEILEDIGRQARGVHAIVIGDRAGLPIASSMRGRPSMTATAMATLAVSAAGKITESLALPKPDDIVIRAGTWCVVIQSLGNGYTLAAVGGPGTDPTALSWSMRLHAEEIRVLLDDMR